MKEFQLFHLVILFSLSLTQALNYSLIGCEEKCGDVIIPYPFGIGPKCSINKWYIVSCISSTPYLSAFNNVEVLGVNLEYQTVIVNVSTISHCRNQVTNSNDHIPSVNLSKSPFVFSKSHNIFIVKGCGNAVILDDGKVFAGCSTTCPNDTVSERNSCFGISCCQTTIPYYLSSYSVDLTHLERLGGDGACGSAFLVDENSYLKHKFSSQSTIASGDTFVPISLLWILTNRDYESLLDLSTSSCEPLFVDLGNRSSVMSRKCECSYLTQKGNPYIRNGCKESEYCAKCIHDLGGICEDAPIFDEFGYRLPGNVTCNYNSYPYRRFKIKLGFILGISISIGLAISYALYKVIKKAKAKRRRRKFFKRNGGLLLKQQAAANTGLVDKTIIFTSSELEKATDHYNENRILGRGGQGTVYKGMLTDGRIVAIKKSKGVEKAQIQQFINEVVILSQVNHRNVVKLLGCCLETEVPLLVSEFVSNGTLYDFIQDDTNDYPISLNMRLQLATEVSGALSYLHSSTSVPIYHRDIKTTNILLDDKYRAKVSDFGTSRLVSTDQTHLTTIVKGTFGYFDPEYFQSSQFTEKSDVYSFGVVLLELLTREKPISSTGSGEHRSLTSHFMMAMEEGNAISLFDTMVVNEGSMDELMAIANLAMRCLNFNGKKRPTMKQVALELEGMRMSHVHSSTIHQTNYGDVNSTENLSMVTYVESKSTSTTDSFSDNNDV